MKILKTACGNSIEAFIENRLTDGVNIIFSNDNNKGKTIIFQGMMYALGNEPIFPSGFNYKDYYFYTCIEHEGKIYEFLRKHNNIVLKTAENIAVFEDVSDLKYYVEKNIFNLPLIIKDDYQKVVDLSLFYQLFFTGQDRRNPSNVINAGYYNKQDFTNMVYSLADCLVLPDSIKKLKGLRQELNLCKRDIETLQRRLSFHKDHPEIANTVSNVANREYLEQARKELQILHKEIADVNKKYARLTNRMFKLKELLSELKSLNLQLSTGKIHCQDCGSKNIIYTNGDISFELTNDLVRANIIQSISDSIELYNAQLMELRGRIFNKQEELNKKLRTMPVETTNILIYTDVIKKNQEDESSLSKLYDKRELLETNIQAEQRKQDQSSEEQKNVKETILSKMNMFYKLIDPDGTQVYKDFFATRDMTFSGSEEQEYYFSRTLALFWFFKYDFPLIMDCFRKGELSTKKENIMIEEYKKTGVQVILSSTLKDEEYSTGEKYYGFEGVNAINYEVNPNSHILQAEHCGEFIEIVNSFGIKI